MVKSTVKLGLSRIARTAKPEYGKSVVKKMTGNLNFPPAEIAELLADLTASSNVLEAANIRARSKSRQDISEAKEAEIVFNTNMDDVGLYVQGKANDNPAISRSLIESAGLQVRKTPAPAPVPDAVRDLQADYTNQPGNILLKWKMPKNATQAYVYMTITPDLPQSWVLVNSLQGRKLLVQNLTSNTRYYFRMEVANRKNQKSGLSDIASTVAA